MAGASLLVDGLEIPAEVHTLDGFRTWRASLGERAPRACFVAGEVHVELSPQDWRSHLSVASDLNAQLALLARRLDVGRYFEQGGWLTNESAALSTEPDGLLVRWETFAAGEARVDGCELRGRADMVLEVVSRSSERKDTVRLVDAYARARVGEYWIVDARSGPPQVRVLDLSAPSPREVGPDADGFFPSRAWGGSFRLCWGHDRIGLPTVEVEHRPGPTA